jgi:hypothetical protein
VAEGKKSLDKLIHLSMSIYYNQDLTKRREKDKRHHDLIAALREAPIQLGPTSTATIVDKRSTSTENAVKGNSLGDSPAPNQHPALSARVSTGGLSAPISRWKVGCHLPWIMGPGLLSRLHFLTSMLKSLGVAIMAEKQKVTFCLDSRACFCLTFLCRSPVQ